jgi:hypothetical protein
VLLSNIRLVAGKNGLSVGVPTFASGARVTSVSAPDGGKRRRVRRIGSTQQWTDALRETIKTDV